MTDLPDIQKTQDHRDVSIANVGVSHVRVPIKFSAANGHIVRTIGEFKVGVALESDVKGTHMSRFTEVLSEHLEADEHFDSTTLSNFLRTVLDKLDAVSGQVVLESEYFVPQLSPVSRKLGIAPFKVQLSSSINNQREPSCFERVTAIVNGKTCCPCSREISGYDKTDGRGKGAHAQRGELVMSVGVRKGEFVWFEELFDVAMKSFSSPVYPLLKRPDEKHVTETAYGNPKFVEDVIRDAAVNLRSMKRKISDFTIKVTNEESIHYHNAFAEVHELLD